MTLGHFLYIPGIALLGVVVGYILGSRAAALQREDAADRARARARARAREAGSVAGAGEVSQAESAPAEPS